MIINVIDFTEYPGLRHNEVSDKSGEEYYHKILNKAFYESYLKNEKLKVNLDGTAGYAPSFLDEAFGNLVFDFGVDLVKKFLEIVSLEEPDLIEIIEDETFNEWQTRRDKKQEPKKTVSHDNWHAIVNGKPVLRNS